MRSKEIERALRALKLRMAHNGNRRRRRPLMPKVGRASLMTVRMNGLLPFGENPNPTINL